MGSRLPELFRAKPVGGARTEQALEELNTVLLNSVNASGEVFLSHTKLDERFTLRLAVGHIRTTKRHVARAWELLQECLRKMTARS